MTRPRIRDRRVALAGGYAALVLGVWLLRDAYDRRGRRKPYLVDKLTP